MLNQLDFVLCSTVKSPQHQWPLELPTNLLSILPPRVAELPSPVSLLHEFVELTTQRLPDAPALEFVSTIENGRVQKRVWTYKELNEEGNRVAKYLFSQDVQPRNLVAICFEKCPEASFAILGILKFGCGYVALDPSAPAARKEYIVRDSGCRLVLTANRGNDYIESALIGDTICSVPVAYVDELEIPSILDPPSTGLIAPSDLCYCLYTSGTTGNPKGCEITHENAVQAMRAFSIQFKGRWDSDSKWLQFASFHFDVSVLEQFWSWSEGICMVSAPRDLMLQDLAGFIKALGITHLDLTPSLATILQPKDVPSLCKGVFITGGEALRQDILNTWGSVEVIHNGYGPTEATIGVTMYPRVPKNGKPSNIGKQFDNVGTYVFEPRTESPVLRGAVGELCVSGKLVGRGYLKNPKLTQALFPTLQPFGERVYRTGDLVRLLHDGSFEFLGRSDDQVKLRGQRLEIGEINSVIKEAAGITNVATFVLMHTKQQRKHLVAFCTFDQHKRKGDIVLTSISEQQHKLKETSEHCQSRLPPYMVPTYFIPINYIPLTPNNKVDRAKLKAFFESLSIEDLQCLYNRAEVTEQMNGVENKIATIFSETFTLDKSAISPTSSLFELGMDSISVIRFVRALKGEGLKAVTPSVVMKHSTARTLAKALDATGRSRDELGFVLAAQQRVLACALKHKLTVATILNVNPSDIELITPCTPLQEGMIAEGTNRQTPAYFMTFELALSTDIDTVKLEQAWEEVYCELQILRAQFIQTDDGFVQVCLRQRILPWAQEKFSTNQEKSGRIQDFRSSWIQANKENLPQPLALMLLQSRDSRSLILNIFHALYDGTSLPLLLDRVRVRYLNGTEQAKAPQFSSVLPYGPLLQNPRSEDFWKSHLAPQWGQLTRRFRAESSSEATSEEHRTLKCTKTVHCGEKLEALRRKLNTAHQAIMQSCWSVVLQRYYNGPVCLQVVTSGRSIEVEGAESVIGPLFNTVLFQPKLKYGDSWATVIKRTHDFNIAMLPFQHTPLSSVYKWLREADRLLEGVDNLFTFQIATEKASTAVNNEQWRFLEEDTHLFSNFACEAELYHHGELNLLIVANAVYFEQKSLNDMMNRFTECLHELLEDADAKINVGDIASNPPVAVSASAGTSVNEEENVWSEIAVYVRKEIATLASIPESGIHQNMSIFELGLDSLDAIKLSSRLSKMGCKIKTSELLRNPTIAKITCLLEERMEPRQKLQEALSPLKKYAEELDRLVRLPLHLKGRVERLLPATPLQEAMYSEMISSGFKRYYNQDVLKIREGINVTALTKAWTKVIEINPILRTALVPITEASIKSSFAQAILRNAAPSYPEIALCGTDEIPSLLQRIEADAQQDGETTLGKFSVVKMSNERYLILSLPHALYDGWSLQLIHEDVRRAYHGLELERPSNDTILEEILVGNDNNEASQFWCGYLQSCSPCVLPTREGCNKDSIVTFHKEKISRLSEAHIRRFCKQESITIHALTQTCFILLLATYSRHLDVVFALVLSGRMTSDSQSVVFPTMNTVAYRSIIHGTFRDMLRDTQDTLSSAIYPHQHFPLRKALSYAGAKSEGIRLFNSMFLFQASPESIDDALTPLYDSVTSHSEVEFALCVEAEMTDKGLKWTVASKSDIMDYEQTETFLSAIDNTLRKLTSQPTLQCFDSDGDTVRIAKLSPFPLNPVANLTNIREIANEPESVPEFSGKRLDIVRRVLSEISEIDEEDILASSSIFQLGLDSISAIKASSLLAHHGLEISVSSIMKAPTVEAIARNSSDEVATKEPSTLDTDRMIQTSPKELSSSIKKILSDHDIDIANVEKVLPATSAQEYFFKTWQHSQDQLFYSTFVYQLTGSLSEESIKRSWIKLIDTNPILRTIMLTQDSERGEIHSIQVVFRSVASKIQFHTTSQPTPPRDRPVQLFVNQTSPTQWTFWLAIHHILYDAISLPLLMQDFKALLSRNEPPLHPPFAPYEAILLRSWDSSYIASAKYFWQSHLHNTPRLPATEKTSPAPTPRPKGRFEVFTPALLPIAPLASLSKFLNTSLPSLILSIFARTLHHHQHSSTPSSSTPAPHSHIALALYLSSRSLHSTLPTLPYPTLAILPLSIDTSLPFGQSVRKIQADVRDIGAAEHVGVTMGQVARWAGTETDTVGVLRVSSSFNFLPADVENGGEDSGGAVQMREDSGSALRPRAVVVDKGEGDDNGALLRDASQRDVYMQVYEVCRYSICLR
jgi:ferricrocin synthase